MTSLRLHETMNLQGDAKCVASLPIHDNRGFLDDAVGSNHDRSCNSKNGGFWMYDGSCQWHQMGVSIEKRIYNTVPEPMVMSPLSSTS